MDLRTKRSLQAIEEAFVESVLAKGFAKTTVSEIAAQAEINRKTFYTYYLDKYDLAEKLGDKLIAKYDQALTTRLKQEGSDLNHLMDSFISNNEDLQLFKALLTIHTEEYDFEADFNHLLKQRCEESFKVTDPLEKELLANYALTSIKYYLTTNEPLSSLRQTAFIEKLYHLIEQDF
ncbi:MAG TPA: TetR/AcrR family transcriptional regulator [Tetragenococcus sp.]|nr:TetR/AcrR family transcriptional regulator [Tetragenococcus sp.]